MNFEILDQGFFARETLEVARDLLGHTLIKQDSLTGDFMAFRIVETEAYTEEDPACHGYGRKTGRAATLYKAPGLAYVYLIYGMYHCLNVVTEAEGRGAAILFRALEPILPEHRSQFKTHGPGRLTKALGITRNAFNERPLFNTESGLFLARGVPVEDNQVIQTTRIGIRLGAELPWRFYDNASSFVSVRLKATPTSSPTLKE